jgi:hypothetical protein
LFSTRTGEHFRRVINGLLRDLNAAKHPGDLLDSLVVA